MSSIRVDSVRDAGGFGFGVGESMELILFFVAERGERSEEEDVVDSLRLWPWGE